MVCVDTSASMVGKPEKIAKSMVFALIKIVSKEKRPIYIINFSSGKHFESLEIDGRKTDVQKIITFFEKSFYGGTDIGGALNYAIEHMKDKFENADVLLVSDFEDYMSVKDEQNINIAKENGTYFYALNVNQNNRENSKILSLMDLVAKKRDFVVS